MARFCAFALLAVISSAAAFVPSFAPANVLSRNLVVSRSTLQTTSKPSVRMMAAELAAAPTAEQLREMAQACQEDGCSVEAVGDLLDQLKAKKKELEMQLVTVDDVLAMLGDMGKVTEKGELEKLVMAVARIFSPSDDDYPYLDYPMGWSGDINKEKKTAWDYNVNTQLKPRKPLYNK